MSTQKKRRLRVQKKGNSLGIRIPAQIAKTLHLHPGSLVSFKVEDGRIIIQPSRYNLNEMLKAITPKNQHHLQLDDDPI